jgi:hypothetical protein
MAIVFNGAYNYARDLYHNLVKPRKYPSESTGQLPVKGSVLTVPKNGSVLTPLANTDLQLVADDLTAGSNWVSRVGSFTANHTGSPTTGLETPLYPSGGFAGVGFRTAVADFTTAKYYKLAYNIAHAITGTSTITYEILMRAGAIATEETVIGRYITALTKYNLRVYMKNDGSNNYRVYAEVDHLVSNAICRAIVTQMSTFLLTLKYDSATQTLSMYINGQLVNNTGDISSSVGVGAVSNDILTDFWIGLVDTTVGLPLVKGQIIEVMRHQELLTDTVIYQRAINLMGLRMDDGTYPAVTFIHNSFGFLPVNGKVWAFTRNWPLINENGMHCNVSFGCTMYSTGITDGSGGVSNLTLTAGVTLVTEAGSINSQINGKTAVIPYDGTLQSAKWFHFGLSQSQKSAATVIWRPTNGSIAYLYLFDETTTKYWVSGTTWSLTPTAIDLSAFIIQGAGTLADPYISNVPFTTEAFGASTHRIDAFVHNNSIIDATKTTYVYWCQICDSGQFASEPLAAIHPTGGDSSVFLGIGIEYPASMINWAFGQLTCDLKPLFPSTQPRLSPSNAMSQFSGSTGNNFLQMNNGSALINFKDNSGHIVAMGPTFAWKELLQLQLTWNTAAGLNGKVTNKAISGNATYTSPLSSGNFKFGTSSQSPGCYIKNVVIR